MISMPVRSPLWTVRSWLWPANGFWWIVPSGLRSKRQPYATPAPARGGRLVDERPHQLLVVDPAAALHGVEEMLVERILLIQDAVVALCLCACSAS